MTTKKTTKQITLTLALISVLGLVTGCASSAPTEGTKTTAEACTPLHAFPTLVKGVLTVVAINGLPKFYGASANGPFTGIDADLITKFAKENCLTVKFKPMTGAAATLDLTEGKSDMFGGIILKSEARGKVFNQTKGAVVYGTLAITSKEGYDTIESLLGKKVGVLSGSSYAEPFKAALGAGNVVEYQSSTDAAADMVAGRIDALGLQDMQGLHESSVHKGFPTKLIMKDDPRYPILTALWENDWPMTKGNTKMTAAVDDFYKQIRADGTLKSVLKKYGIPDELLDFFINGR
ncbi:MAG: substrate-binding periplasmic protein [Lacisediminihabitans sp.]